MLRKEMDIHKRCRPIPITVLISAANCYSCDIFIEYTQEDKKVNVKDYEEMKNELKTQDGILLFYFNGLDEERAESRIEKLFEQ